MTLYEAVSSYLMGDSTISSAVNGVVPSSLPPSPNLPLIVQRRISGSVPKLSFDGDAPPSTIRLELTVYGPDIKACEQVANRIFQLFKGFRGSLAGGPKFNTIGFNGPRDVYDATSRESGMQIDVLGLLDEDTVS